MSAGIVILGLLFGIFFIFYKRRMLIKMFSLNIETMADEFRVAMISTADDAVKKLEFQMSQLEYLLEEADAKILALENQLRQTEETLTKSGVLASQAVEKTLSDSAKGFSAMPITQNTASLQKKADIITQFPQPQPLPQFSTTLQDIAQDKRQQVLLLHRQGYNVMEIAKATSMGKGEVMLLLELNKT